MAPSSSPPDKTPVQYSAVGTKFVTVGGEVGCLTLVIVLAAVFGGLWLDQLLGTKPLLTVLLVLASAPVSLVLTFWVARRAIGDMNPSPKANGKNSTTEGEKAGE